jgi:formylglycine-generating enzyme required for sulfatase activity
MGSPLGELGREINETQHEVTLTQEFYIGVFELTQKQWERVMGVWPSYFSNASVRDARPVEKVSYYDIRGSLLGAGWPASSAVDATSFMGKLRQKTGLTALDLPTESQWEYACRAGTTTALNNGTNLTSITEDVNVALVGRYLYNSGSGPFSADNDLAKGTAAVGSYLANAWGLYDMHGNVYEWSLDWYQASYPGTVSDPRGAASGSYRVLRGGGWGSGAQGCRSACRIIDAPSSRYVSLGCRVARTLP